MQVTPVRLPSSATPQFWSDITHATVIVIVVVAATIAGAMHFIHETTVGNVYTAAIGYAAGRAGSVAHRTLTARHTDQGNANPPVDITG